MSQNKSVMKKIIFLALAAAALFLAPAVSLFIGIAFALIAGQIFKSQTLKASKYLLQASVVGLGFGMNLMDSIRSSSEGIVFTVFSVVLVMTVGTLLARYFKVERKLGYLISSGTAICGGSAIAAISPVVKADSNQTSMSLAVVFTLNAVALFVFPTLGRLLDLTQTEFGTWAAIAIHDTSSVIGAGKAYGQQALEVATTVKLTRALWIIPLSLASTLFFKGDGAGRSKISIPWFILLFILAMITNTYMPLGDFLSMAIKTASHKMLSLTLFLIGSTLSLDAIRGAGLRPIALGVALWFTISVVSLAAILLV